MVINVKIENYLPYLFSFTALIEIRCDTVLTLYKISFQKRYTQQHIFGALKLICHNTTGI